jgi:hypothetical protein
MITAPPKTKHVYKPSRYGTRVVQTKGAVRQGGGGSEIFLSPLPTHHFCSQTSQIKNTTEQQAHKNQSDKMPSDRMTATKEVQADILSTLKKTSYFNNNTTRAHINSLHLEDFNRLKRIAKGRKVTCERAIKACIDGQQPAPRKTEYKYHYRLFTDYMEILQIELDRITNHRNSRLYGRSRRHD